MIRGIIADRKLLKQLNIKMVFIAALIVLYGCMNIYSATVSKKGTYYLKLQIIWFVLALIVCAVVTILDYNLLYNFTPALYWGSILLLIYNDLTSKHINGATSWISLGSRAIQPSEFARLAMILMLAKKLKEMEGDINNIKNFSILSLYALIPMLLIVIQPDAGMTMVCLFIVLGIFFIMGLNLKVIVFGFTSIVIVVAAVWNSALMQHHWRDRIVSFIHPEANELGTGMQLAYAKIGIGSGNIFGSGIKLGSSSGSGFIAQFMPEALTDFIFSVVGEKWGFVGAIGLLIIYSLLLISILRISMKSSNIYGKVICVGVFSSFLFSIIQNIGMNIGILPITGITLPFMSYGGSSMLTNFIALGLVLNVGMQNKKTVF